MKTHSGDEIKQKAKELYFAHGLKSVSMDDIAAKTGLSKRTIYKVFADKNQLVFSIVKDLLQSYQQLFEIAKITSKNAIDEVLKQDHETHQVWKDIRPTFFYELEKYFPEAFELSSKYRSIVLQNVSTNLARGKKEGLYRNDTDIAFLADLRMHQLINVLNPELLTSHRISINQLATEFTILYLHSVTSEEGKKLLHDYLKENTE